MIFSTILSSLQIAQKYNINPTTINDIIRGDIHYSSKLQYPLRKRNTKPQTRTKLNEVKVVEIISLLKKTDIKIKSIAEKYNISPQSITDINIGRTWKELYINGEYPIRNKNNI